jgi:hypothetical protein
MNDLKLRKENGSLDTVASQSGNKRRSLTSKYSISSSSNDCQRWKEKQDENRIKDMQRNHCNLR